MHIYTHTHIHTHTCICWCMHVHAHFFNVYAYTRVHITSMLIHLKQNNKNKNALYSLVSTRAAVASLFRQVCGRLCCCALQCVAVRCCVLQFVAVCCSVLQCVAAWCLQRWPPCCNTLQHTATHCNTLQHTATHSNTLQHMQHTATHSNTALASPFRQVCGHLLIYIRDLTILCVGQLQFKFFTFLLSSATNQTAREALYVLIFHTHIDFFDTSPFGFFFPYIYRSLFHHTYSTFLLSTFNIAIRQKEGLDGTWFMHMDSLAESYGVYNGRDVSVPWGVCDMTHQICGIRRVLMCDTTHSYRWHDPFMCDTWLIPMGGLTYLYVWHDSFLCEAWVIHMCNMTHSYV